MYFVHLFEPLNYLLVILMDYGLILLVLCLLGTNRHKRRNWRKRLKRDPIARNSKLRD